MAAIKAVKMAVKKAAMRATKKQRGDGKNKLVMR
jgi:hypothetical protein